MFVGSLSALPSRTAVSGVEERLSFLENPLLDITLGLCRCLVVKMHLHLPTLCFGVSGVLLPPLLTLACCPLTLVAYRLQSACHGRAHPFRTITTLGQSWPQFQSIAIPRAHPVSSSCSRAWLFPCPMCHAKDTTGRLLQCFSGGSRTLFALWC